MRLPAFAYLTPSTLEEAVVMLRDSPGAAVIGAGTDLLPNMKRRQVQPTTLVSLGAIPDLAGIRGDAAGGVVIGALTTLRDVAASPDVPRALRAAAGSVASPQIRNTATVGGNLCVDTRCSYINATEEWRIAAGPCLKAGGDVCWVAPKGDQCWAVSSTDLAPAAIVIGASVRLVGPDGERTMPVADLYRPDGIDHMVKGRDEILTEVSIPPSARLRSTYLKLRRRRAVDFPMLGVAAAVRCSDDGTVQEARLVLGAIAPAPLRAAAAEEFLMGRRLTPEVVDAASQIAAGPVRPFDNADLGSRYRKWMAAVFVARALRELSPPGRG